MWMTPFYDMTLLSIISRLKEVSKEELRKEYKENFSNQLDNELKTLQSCHAISINEEGTIKYIGQPVAKIQY